MSYDDSNRMTGRYRGADIAAIDAGLKVVNSTLAANFVRPDEANKAQSMVKDKGKHTFIDKVKVRYLADDDKHWAELVNFGHKYVHVPEHYLREFDRLLMGGIWAQVDIKHQYDEEAKGKKSPFWIEGLKPIQLATFDLDELKPYQGRLAALEVPALILWGQQDDYLPSDYAARFASEIPGAKLVSLESAHHFLFEDEPERCAQEVTEFLRHVA